MGIKTGPVKSARFFGIAAVALIVLVSVGVFIANAIIADTGFAIAAFLIIWPFTLLFAGLLGVVAIVLAIVTAVKSEREKKGWVLPLVLGIIAALIAPFAFFIWVWAAG